MTLLRRRLLQAVATSPILLFAPGLTQRALAHDPTSAARGGLRVPTPTGGGISISWDAHASSESVGSIRALVDGVWSAPITVHPDHHSPELSDGRVHGQAILVPNAEMYEIAPDSNRFSYDVHPIGAPSRRLTRLADGGLSHIEPIPGLQIIERSNWTGRARKDTIDCVIGSSVYGLGCRSDVGIRHAVVHHTVNINNYTMDDVPELLDGIQRYHMVTRGWDDIAYNFVIDRFGRIWQAREAELLEPITGGHTTGLNAESIGVALLGTFTDLDPGQAVIDSLGMLLGWKLGLHGVDPLGVTEVRSSGGDFSEPGDMVLVDNISSHRDNQSTSCPGNGTVARLDEVRRAAAELVTIFGTVVPNYFLDRIEFEGWAIDRFTPDGTVDINFVLNGEETVVAASERVAGLDSQYPDAGADHGFTSTVPIDIDTTSITATAVAGDGRATELLNLSMFATFIDVEPERFFAPGIFWLRKNELTLGTLPGLFEPMDHLNRAQMAVFLWRFMDKPVVETEAPFADIARPSWYAAATDWLYASGITKGVTTDLFAPGDFVTRGQMAAFLWRLCGSIPAQGATQFNDVWPGSYYATAVAWMAETGVTTGVTPSLFAPNQQITRGEMATFLHRLATAPEAWAVVEPPSVV